MIGITNGVMEYLSKQQPELINIGCLVILWILQQRRVPKLCLSVLKIYWSTSGTTLKNQRSRKENLRNSRCYVMVKHPKFSSMSAPAGCLLDYAYKDLSIIGLHFCISLRKRLQKLEHSTASSDIQNPQKVFIIFITWRKFHSHFIT